MAVSLNNYLRTLAYEYYISYSSDENKKIEKSYSTIAERLTYYFGSKLLTVNTFGSYNRDTILPRKYDSYSDIDILIKFDHANLDKTAETYRTWLLAFANKYYSTSEVYKSFPTVVVELQHIMFDLVPAKEEKGFWSNQLYIPDTSNDWQETDPDSLSNTVAEANKKYDYLVKPIIRLLKAWNSKAGKPYSSYQLETAIASMNFYNDDMQSGFFYAIGQLSDMGKAQWAKDKIAALKSNKESVVYWLNQNDLVTAKLMLHTVIPAIV